MIKFKKYAVSLMIPVSLGLCFFSLTAYADAPSCEEQLNLLEPEKPTTLPNPPFEQAKAPKDIEAPSTVVKKQNEIPFETVLNLPEWSRPSYVPYWHSDFERWAYVPNRIHYAKHRLFTSSTNASAYYDFVHNIGIAQEMKGVSFNDNSLSKIMIAVMNTDIKDIYWKNQQVVITGKPKHNGLNVITIENPAPGKSLYFQLTTTNGDEIDYNLF